MNMNIHNKNKHILQISDHFLSVSTGGSEKTTRKPPAVKKNCREWIAFNVTRPMKW